jgi:mRNA interferase RelE/StbE
VNKKNKRQPIKADTNAGPPEKSEGRRWHVLTTEEFEDAVRRLDKGDQRQVLKYLEALDGIEDPTARGKALTGPLTGTWRYRVGNYRVLARLEHDTVTILALTVEHRSTVYKG